MLPLEGRQASKEKRRGRWLALGLIVVLRCTRCVQFGSTALLHKDKLATLHRPHTQWLGGESVRTRAARVEQLFRRRGASTLNSAALTRSWVWLISGTAAVSIQDA